MSTAPYWPDLTLLPVGWGIVAIRWAQGRATVTLVRNTDKIFVHSTGNHHTPDGAFRDALAKAEGGA